MSNEYHTCSWNSCSVGGRLLLGGPENSSFTPIKND